MYLTNEDRTFQNISATTSAFTLLGGQYGIQVTATFGGGNVALQRLSPDGSTWVQIQNFTVAGYINQYLPPGQYRFAVTTATAVYAECKTIPF